MRGPIDYIIVGFEGNKFNGSVLSALGDAIDSGTIALIDLSVVTKDDAGVVTAVKIADVGDEYALEFVQKYNPGDEDVTTDDIDEIGDLLEPNTAAGLLVIEQLWAKPLKAALIEANGVLIADGRIHPDAADELNDKEEK